MHGSYRNTESKSHGGGGNWVGKWRTNKKNPEVLRGAVNAIGER